MLIEIDAQIARDEHVGTARAGVHVRATQQRVDPGQQLLTGERLGLVVVGARFEAGHLVFLAAEPGEDQDGRDDAVRAQLAADLDAVHARHTDVQQVQVGLDLAAGFEGAEPV
jgi:hypothetical protein